MIRTCSASEGIVIEKFPSKSVIAPIDSEPLSWTVAPGNGELFSSFTIPVTVLDCEKTNKGNRNNTKNFFILIS